MVVQIVLWISTTDMTVQYTLDKHDCKIVLWLGTRGHKLLFCTTLTNLSRPLTHTTLSQPLIYDFTQPFKTQSYYQVYSLISNNYIMFQIYTKHNKTSNIAFKHLENLHICVS